MSIKKKAPLKKALFLFVFISLKFIFFYYNEKMVNNKFSTKIDIQSLNNQPYYNNVIVSEFFDQVKPGNLLRTITDVRGFTIDDKYYISCIIPKNKFVTVLEIGYENDAEKSLRMDPKTLCLKLLVDKQVIYHVMYFRYLEQSLIIPYEIMSS